MYLLPYYPLAMKPCQAAHRLSAASALGLVLHNLSIFDEDWLKPFCKLLALRARFCMLWVFLPALLLTWGFQCPLQLLHMYILYAAGRTVFGKVLSSVGVCIHRVSLRW
jgi:hypothetical protein